MELRVDCSVPQEETGKLSRDHRFLSFAENEPRDKLENLAANKVIDWLNQKNAEAITITESCSGGLVIG